MNRELNKDVIIQFEYTSEHSLTISIFPQEEEEKKKTKRKEKKKRRKTLF